MFRSAVVFRINRDFALPPLALFADALARAAFLPCGATQAESMGWVAPRGNKSDVLVESVVGGVILQLQTERRQVPASAIAEAVEAKVERYKQETGREGVGSKLKKEFKEEALLDLLPRAFTKKSSVLVWVGVIDGFLVVDAGSPGGADKVVSALVAAIAECGEIYRMACTIKPLQTNQSPAASMAFWLGSQASPHNFSVDRECELKTPDDQKSTVRYDRHTLEIDEIVKHIESGKVPTKLALTWNERVSFVLNDAGCLGKITMLDVVLDGKDKAGKDDDGFNADIAIATGELAGLIPGLIDALGGELGVAAETETETETDSVQEVSEVF